MMKYRNTFLFSLLLLAIVILATDARACTCIYGVLKQEDLAANSNIAVFKVVSLDSSDPPGEYYQVGGVRRIKLIAKRVYKGEIKQGEEVSFVQGSGADCVWVFKDEDTGKSFLFYLGEALSGGVWAPSNCVNSGRVEDVPENIKYLEKRFKKGPKRPMKAMNPPKR